MILITGATGTIGSEVLRLASRGEQVRAMTRNSARIAVAPGVEVVQGDFDDPRSLRRAVAGVTTLFLLTAPASPGADHDLAMLAAAREAGVTKVVKLSAIGTGAKDEAGKTIGPWHLAAEQAVQASGLAWTVLRPSSFASNVLSWAGAINAGEPVPNLLGTGTQGVIDPRDVAAVAVEALTSTDHDGRTYTLTGPESLSASDQAAQLEEVLGRPVEPIDVPLEVARGQMVAAGMDERAVDAIITGSGFARAGHNAVLTDEVATVLGRAPGTFADWARRHQDAFSAGRQ